MFIGQFMSPPVFLIQLFQRNMTHSPATSLRLPELSLAQPTTPSARQSSQLSMIAASASEMIPSGVYPMEPNIIIPRVHCCTVAGTVSRTVVSHLERLKILYQVQNAGMEEYKLSVNRALKKIVDGGGWHGMMRFPRRPVPTETCSG